MNQCQYCGSPLDPNAALCQTCGASNTAAVQNQMHPPAPPQPNPFGPPPPVGPPPPGFQQPYGPPVQPQKNPMMPLAGVALGFGLFALIIPIPVIDIILGILGAIFAGIAMAKGVKGLAIAALVISIIGTIVALFFNLGVFAMSLSVPVPLL